MHSSFAEAKTIRDIGSYLPISPYDKAEHDLASGAWLKRSSGQLPSQVENVEFFGNSMADGYLDSIEIEPTRVKVSVGDGFAWTFALCLTKIFDLAPCSREFPVDLLMHEPTAVRAVSHDESGTLQTVSLALEAGTPGVYLVNEWFVDRGGSLGWVAELHGAEHSPSRGSNCVHLLVECARASAEDRRQEVMIQTFGSAVGPLWAEAQRIFAPRMSTAHAATYDDIAEFISCQDLNRSDLRVPSS